MLCQLEKQDIAGIAKPYIPPKEEHNHLISALIYVILIKIFNLLIL